MKVLLFSNDTMPFASLPTSGGGLRCWQIYQGLKSAGIEVIASMQAFTFLTQKYFSEIPEDVKANLWEWHTQDDIYSRNKPDAVIFASNWDHYNLSRKPSVPLIVDLHGSRLIETGLFGEQADSNKKAQVFAKADLLLTAGRRQRNYFYGWLTQAGRVPEKDHFIRYIPVSLAPEEFIREDMPTESKDLPLIVSGGGWFPWQDQSKAIFSIAHTLVQKEQGRLKIYGTPHNNPSPSPEEMAIKRTFASVEDLAKKHDQVEVVGYVGRDELLNEYRRASVALELMKYNLERELAFTTRTIEYLWCGLPVIYNNYSEISEHIVDYDAGWAIDPEDDTQLESVLKEIIENPLLVRQKSDNAKRLVKDRFSWDKTIMPLVEFLNNPVRQKELSPCSAFVAGRASYLTPAGASIHIPLANSRKDSAQYPVKQRFIFPAEGIWAVEVPYAISGSESETACNDCFISLRVKNSSGITMSKRKHFLKDIPSQGSFLLPLSRIFRPRGGSEGVLEVEYVETARETDEQTGGRMQLLGLLEETYPLIHSPQVASLKGKDDLGRDSYARTLQLRFHAGASRLYHIRSMLERAYWLIRQGEIRRVVRAVNRKFSFKRGLLSVFKSIPFRNSAQKV